jgi:transposase
MSRRKVEIKMKYATYEKIQSLYRETNDADLKIRYLAMLKFMEGYTSNKVAELLNASGSTVREWLNRYNRFGPDGLIPQKPKGPECRLTDEQLEQVRQILIESPREYGFNKSNWSMPVLKIWISREFGINYSASSLYDLVHRIGFSMQRPKKKCKNADPEKQEAFKKELKDLVENADDDTVILYEDEAIITDEPTTTGKWAPVGKQPVVQTNSKGSRKRRVIFGACNPKTGEVIYSTEEAGNSESFEDFLK